MRREYTVEQGGRVGVLVALLCGCLAAVPHPLEPGGGADRHGRL